MLPPPPASYRREIVAALASLDWWVKAGALAALVAGLTALLLPSPQASFALGPAVVACVLFGQLAVVRSADAPHLFEASRGPEGPAPEVVRGRARVAAMVTFALPGFVALCWRAGLAVGAVSLLVLALEIGVVRYLRRSVRRG